MQFYLQTPEVFEKKIVMTRFSNLNQIDHVRVFLRLLNNNKVQDHSKQDNFSP